MKEKDLRKNSGLTPKQIRAIKNRESAQASRDRKRRYFELLEENNKLLKAQNEDLKSRLALVEEQNKAITEKLNSLLQMPQTPLSLSASSPCQPVQSNEESLDPFSLETDNSVYDSIQPATFTQARIPSGPRGAAFASVDKYMLWIVSLQSSLSLLMKKLNQSALKPKTKRRICLTYILTAAFAFENKMKM